MIVLVQLSDFRGLLISEKLNNCCPRNGIGRKDNIISSIKPGPDVKINYTLGFEKCLEMKPIKFWEILRFVVAFFFFL